MTAAAAAASRQILDLSRAIAASERSILLGFTMLGVGAMLAWPAMKILLAATLSVVTLHLISSRA